MFSSRLPHDVTPNAIARAADRLRSIGTPVIDLTESNPTRAGLRYPDGLLDALSDRRTLTYEPHPLGLLSAREAVAADFARHAIEVSPDRIGLTASTSEAYSLLFKLLCDAGDEVLIPRPSYPLFEHLTLLECVRAVPYRLEYHGAWRIDVDEMKRLTTPRTRIVLVVSPNNPTGSFLHSDDLAMLGEWCAARQLALVGDEVFVDFPLDVSAAATRVVAHAPALTCSLGGLSKSAALPQAKLSWIAFAGPAAVARDAVARYEVIADTYLSVSTPVQVAAPALLASAIDTRAQIQQRLRRNLDRLKTLAADHPAVTVLRVEGGWTAVLQVPALRSEESLVLSLLHEDRVLVHPGFFFDFPREAFVVVSLLVEPETFDRGVARLLARATGVARS